MFSKNDLERLENKASSFVSECRPRYRALKVFYRNKPQDYFTDVQFFQGGIMKPLLKDNNGDPKCPSNGNIKGLFFMGKNDKKTPDGLPDASPFGERRVMVPAEQIFNSGVNLYFSDFWCHKVEHYVSLVITKPGSSADRFCKSNLLPLDIFKNKYLRISWQGQVEMLHGYTFWIEVFYTEPISLNSPGIKFSTVGIIGRGRTTPGGIRKSASCTTCNMSTYTPTPTWNYNRSYEAYDHIQPASAQVRPRTNYNINPVVRQPATQYQPEENNGGILNTILTAVGQGIASVWNWFTGN